MSNKAYQLLISLNYIRPEIWRRFLVSNEITLAKLHKIIQVVMGWEDYHLHEFRIDGIRYGEPDDEWDDVKVTNDKKVRLRDIELVENQKFTYLYDFGDYWEHEVTIEKVLPAEKGVKYPKCLEGKRACPPEDCSGPPGYENLIRLFNSQEDIVDDDDIVRLNWLGEDHDFEYFSSDEVNSVLWKRFAK